MTYYEELGVPPTASTENIRRAYRTLARLLHPDQQQDEDLRVAANRQLRRLNLIVEVLTDPERRSRYDAEIARSLNPAHGWQSRLALPGGVADRRRPTELLAWAIATVIAAGALWWLVPSSGNDRFHGTAVEIPSEPEARGPRSNISAEPRAVPKIPVLRQNAQRDDRGGRDAAPSVYTPPLVYTPPEPTPTAPDLPLLPEQNTPVRPPAVPAIIASDSSVPAPKPAVRAPDPFAGRWFFSKDYFTPEQGLYPPEYVELVLNHEAGNIHGRYRATYRVTDKTLSPDVQFSFSGHTDAAAPELPWVGIHGARGQIRLKPLTENSMQVSWWATELPRAAQLASGTAVLIRLRQD